MRRFFLPLLTFLALAAPAQADVTASTITTPKSPHYAIWSDPDTTIAVAGTAHGIGNVDIACLGATSTTVLAHDVPVAGDGAFSDDAVVLDALVDPTDWSPGQTCRLRAIPAGTTPADVGNFRGPTLALSRFHLVRNLNSGVPEDFLLWAAGTEQATEINAFGSCGAASAVLDPDTLDFGDDGFSCAGGPPDEPDVPLWGVKVDGVAAYTRAALGGIGGYGASGLAGAPAFSVDPVQFDADTGAVSVSERDGFAKCGPDVSYPPTQFSCTYLDGVPVQLRRTTSVLAKDHILRVVDRWSSTDNKPHRLDLALATATCCSTHQAFRFPGESGFSLHDVNDATPLTDRVAGPFRAGTPILARDVGNAGGGELVLPLQSANGARFTDEATFALQYDARTIPASGELTFTHYYALTAKAADLEAAAAKLVAAVVPKPPVPAPHGGGPVITPPKPRFSRHGRLHLRRVGRTFRVTTRDRVVCACTVHVSGRWVVPTDLKASFGRTNAVRFRLTRGGARTLRRAGRLRVRYVLAAPGVTKQRTVRLRTGTS
jgi:hypothetical protein